MYNFAAGPATLPQEVLLQAREALLDWEGTGLSILELPFTGEEYRSIVERARADLRALLRLPEDYHILFLQGGAYAHFALLAMNLLGRRQGADYAVTGHWSRRACNEARRYGEIRIAASSEAEGFPGIPPRKEWRLDPRAAYCHITTNETANGIQYHWLPDTGEVPLVADMTSDFLTRKIGIRDFAMVYASAQKNVGTAGLTIVVVREELLGRALPVTPAVFDYTRQADSVNGVNTPPTFAIYLSGLIFAWLRQRGGLDWAEDRSRRRSERLYRLIDDSALYHCPVRPDDRSRVNVCFHLPTPELESRFLAGARDAGLLNLAGHGAAGGIRVSLYNAMPGEGVERLLDFMSEFERRHGGGD